MAPLTSEQVLQSLNGGQPVSPHGPPQAGRVEIAAVDLEGRTFDKPVCFSGARFREQATFRGAHFKQGANFFDCVFDGGADFSWCHVFGKAYFWRSRFAGPAVFSDATVVPLEVPDSHRLYPGEANFSWATFAGRADFGRTRFGGKSWFWRTVFGADVTFEEAKFEAGVVFGGRAHEVCLSAADFSDGVLLRLLIGAGLMTPDRETEPPLYWHFKDVADAEKLRRLLSDLKLHPRQVDEIVGVWKASARPMFAGPGGGPVPFRGAVFGKPEESAFGGVSLERCLFADCDVSKVDFTDVRWWHRPTWLLLGGRQAVRDEQYASTASDYRVVEKLYRRLRKNYEGKGAYADAGDFHYGEMEMRRLAQPAVLRHISLAALYKYLSGYGEQHGLALFWLLFFVFVLFPALYLLVGAIGEPAGAVLHSLEVSTFLKPESAAAVPTVGRFVEGCERIVVPVQAGLFLLAIRRQYARQ
jgi:uncharacterized protein YjbI with pentapeptide repeats